MFYQRNTTNETTVKFMFKDNFCIFWLGPYFSHFFVCPSETGDDYLKNCTALIESIVSSKGKVNLLKVLAFVTDNWYMLTETDVFVKEQVPFCSSFIYVKDTFFKHHLGSPSQCSNNHQLWCKVSNSGFIFTKPDLVIVGIVENPTGVV